MQDGEDHTGPGGSSAPKRPRKRRVRTPEEKAQAAARRRERQRAKSSLRWTLVVLGVWSVAAMVASVLLGWSWPIGLVVVVVLMGFAATGDRGLVQIGAATAAVFGVALLLTLNGDRLVATVVYSPSPTTAPTSALTPAATLPRTPQPISRVTTSPASTPHATATATPTPTPEASSATPLPTARPTSRATSTPANQQQTIPGLTDAMILRAFGAYPLDCEPVRFLTRQCNFTTAAGDDVILAIEESSSTEIHIVSASVSDPLAIDVPETLRVLELVATLPYAGSNPSAAENWLYANYGETGFTPKETQIGPGHFVLRVSEPKIGDLELRALDY